MIVCRLLSNSCYEVTKLPATVACEHMSAQEHINMARPRARSEQLSPNSVYAPELLAEVLGTKDQNS